MKSHKSLVRRFAAFFFLACVAPIALRCKWCLKFSPSALNTHKTIRKLGPEIETDLSNPLPEYLLLQSSCTTQLR